jgi:hypothetical protein
MWKNICDIVLVSECSTWTSRTRACERYLQNICNACIFVVWCVDQQYRLRRGRLAGVYFVNSWCRNSWPLLLSNSSSLLVSTSFQITSLFSASKQHRVCESDGWTIPKTLVNFLSLLVPSVMLPLSGSMWWRSSNQAIYGHIRIRCGYNT